MNRRPPSHVLASGYAQAPRGTCLAERWGSVGVVLEIDPATHTIVDAEFMLNTELARRFCRERVVGYCLAEGVEPLLREMALSLAIPSQQAFIMAVRSAVQRYWERVSPRNRVPSITAG